MRQRERERERERERVLRATWHSEINSLLTMLLEYVLLLQTVQGLLDWAYQRA